jgi:hypothetical protein
MLITPSSLNRLVDNADNILLINSPAIDTRLPWAAWQQPVGLLKIGSLLRERGHSVRLIDCLQVKSNNRLNRSKVDQLKVEKYNIDLWLFGLTPRKVISMLREWEKGGWKPDLVLVSCALSVWWEGAKILISEIKSNFNGLVVLGGAYPTYYPEHASIHSGADAIFIGELIEAAGYASDLSIYAPGRLPHFAAINLLHKDGVSSELKTREPEAIANEIQVKAEQGVTTFAFFDEWLGPELRHFLIKTLNKIIELNLQKVRFIAPGNISPRVVDKELAKVLKQVGLKHIYLHDDVSHSPGDITYLSSIEEYKECISQLHEAGFRPRSDEIGAAVLLGLPHEDLNQLTRRIVHLSSITGSVHLVPYQFTPNTGEGKKYESWLAQRDGNLELKNLNGRLFPLARFSGKAFDDYLEIIRLVALLNSKFHSSSFDFLGSGLTAQLVRKSLHDELWDPFQETKHIQHSIEIKQ